MLSFNTEQEQKDYFLYSDEAFVNICKATPLFKVWQSQAADSKILQYVCKVESSKWEQTTKEILFRVAKVILISELIKVVKVDFTMAMYSFWVYLSSMDNLEYVDDPQYEFNFYLCVATTLSNGYLDKEVVDGVVAGFSIPKHIKDHLNSLRDRGTVAVVDLRPFLRENVISH